MKTLLTLILAMNIVACGTDESSSTAAQEQQTQATTETAKQASSGNGDVVLSLDAQDDWIFVAEPMHYYDAEAQAPDGYRLPARWELIKAFDEGVFEKINTMLWTGTEAGDDGFKVWRIVLSNMPGYLVTKTQVENKQNYNYAAYVREAR